MSKHLKSKKITEFFKRDCQFSKSNSDNESELQSRTRIKISESPKTVSNKNLGTESIEIPFRLNNDAALSQTITDQTCQNQSKIDDSLLKCNKGESKIDDSTPDVYVENGRKFYFQKRWFSEYPWIQYDNISKKVVCRECVYAHANNLFSGCSVNPSFINHGYGNWKKGIDRFQIHEKSNQHKTAILKNTAQESVPILNLLGSQVQNQQIIARKCLKTMITTVKFLGRQGLAFQAHESDRGNFVELLHLRENDVPELLAWFNRKKHFMSHDIQNELIRLVSHNILRRITSKIQDQNFCLIVDETCDISSQEQVSICVRTVNEDLIAEEYFLGFYSTSSTTAETLASLILDALTRFGLKIENLRGQCYDGASNMSGKFNGVQKLLLEKQPKALYIHCNNHCLNLALQDVVKKIPLLRDAMQWIHDVGVMIKRSPKRLEKFTSIAKDQNLNVQRVKPLCPQRMTVRMSSIISILNAYPVLLEFLQELTDSNEDCSPAASGLHNQFEKGSVLFSILICREIFERTENLSKILQRPSLTVAGTLDAALKVVLFLIERSSDKYFNQLWAEMEEKVLLWKLLEPQLPRKRKVPIRLKESLPSIPEFSSPKLLYHSIYKECFKTIIDEITRRFDQPGLRSYIKIEYIVLSQNYEHPDYPQILSSVCEIYGINSQRLSSQLSMLRHMLTNRSSVTDVVNSFCALHKETQTLFTEIIKIFHLLIVIPTSSATAERSFSMLRRIKNYLRNSMGQQRLNNLGILAAYPEMVDETNDYDIMKEFIKNDSRINVFGKV